MADMENIYQKLTNVNLKEQYEIWDERGKGYYGEFIVFSKLYKNIIGNAKFLMNLQIPVDENSFTEIDLLMIHETAIYVFEIKHFKGDIYGKSSDKTWTQYFKTSSNNKFKNPILQNEYHINALKRLFPTVPIYSVIVFSSTECNLHIENTEQDAIVTRLEHLSTIINNKVTFLESVFSMDQVNSIFERLKDFSPLKEQTVVAENDNIVPFYDYVHSFKKDIDAAVTEFNCNTQKLKNEMRKNKIQKWLFTALIGAICIFATLSICMGYKTISNNEVDNIKSICESQVAEASYAVEEMKQNFETVDLNNPNNRMLAEGMLTVNCSLNMSNELTNTAILECSITDNAELYGIILNKDSSYIIQLKDGTVKEYKMFDVKNQHTLSQYRITGSAGKAFYRQTIDLKPLEIYHIEATDEIDYIKITNVSLWKYGENNNNALVNGLELELYSGASGN